MVFGSLLGGHLGYLKLLKVDFVATKLKKSLMPQRPQINHKTLQYSQCLGMNTWLLEHRPVHLQKRHLGVGQMFL